MAGASKIFLPLRPCSAENRCSECVVTDEEGKAGMYSNKLASSSVWLPSLAYFPGSRELPANILDAVLMTLTLARIK